MTTINITKKCLEINDDDKLVFGDGGSTAIILIKDKYAYKIFTLYSFSDNPNKKKNRKIMNKNTINEMMIYMLLTIKIINEKISNHIVKCYELFECDNAEKIFNKCGKSYVDFIKTEDNKKLKLCYQYFSNYPNKKLEKNYKAIKMEYCDYSCAEFISDISQMPSIMIEKYLDVFFFQMLHTLLSIQSVFPSFNHNDLFIRNIIGLKEKDNGNYYCYRYLEHKYYVPQLLF
jgi:hypothetical protein